jgi:hypothetical protein
LHSVEPDVLKAVEISKEQILALFVGPVRVNDKRVSQLLQKWGDPIAAKVILICEIGQRHSGNQVV